MMQCKVHIYTLDIDVWGVGLMGLKPTPPNVLQGGRALKQAFLGTCLNITVGA